MPTLRSSAAAALAAAATLALVACTAPADDTAAPTAAPSAPTGIVSSMRPADRPMCLPEGAAAVTTGPEDDPTLVAFAGSGTRGVVLAPQSDGQVCQWAQQLVRLVEEGYLVATFSWSGVGERSFTDAVDVLRGVGATEVAFVGASKGGMYSAALADELDPVTVVALGPPVEYDGHDAHSTSSSYTGPLLVIASTEDRSVPALSSKLVARADDPATFVELSGSAHGVQLFNGEHREQVEQLIDDALASGFGG
ncbi:alpha/beta hydrolase [Cellulomonas sp. P5_C5]